MKTLMMQVALLLLCPVCIMGQSPFFLSDKAYCADRGPEEGELKIGTSQILYLKHPSSKSRAQRCLDNIINVKGIPAAGFSLELCGQLSSGLATMDEGRRMILFDEEFVNELPLPENQKNIVCYFSLAHEVTHHLNGDFFDRLGGGAAWENHEKELWADYAAGGILAKVLEMNHRELFSALRVYFSHNRPCYTHPAFEERILWILGGWLIERAKAEPGRRFLEMGDYSYYSTRDDEGFYEVIQYDHNTSSKTGFGVREYPKNKEGFREVFVGYYQDGEREGPGSSIYFENRTDKYAPCRYFGNFHLGERNGNGELFSRDGRHFDGQWKNGKQHGFGFCSYPNGRIYFGKWSKGERHGMGVEIDPDEEDMLGFWEGSNFRNERHLIMGKLDYD